MAGFIQIPAPKTADPAGSPLAAVLNAQRRSEDWAARRLLLGRSVIVLSLPMAYLLVSGLGLAPVGSRLVITLWSLSLGGLIACAAVEAQARRLVDRLLRQAGGRRFDRES